MGPEKDMGIDISDGLPLYTINNTETEAAFTYFNVMLYSLGEKGFEEDKLGLDFVHSTFNLAKKKLNMGNNVWMNTKAYGLCPNMTPADNVCGNLTINGQVPRFAATQK